MVDVIALEWKPLTETAKQPERAHEDDAAWDLFADCSGYAEDGEKFCICVAPGQTTIIPTNIALMPPKGWSCDIRGRSGMSSKGKLVALGLVDAFYTGKWGVILFNATKEEICIYHHDKIAQFKVEPVYQSKLVRVEEFSLPENTRGDNGFGSSGR